MTWSTPVLCGSTNAANGYTGHSGSGPGQAVSLSFPASGNKKPQLGSTLVVCVADNNGDLVGLLGDNATPPNHYALQGSATWFVDGGDPTGDEGTFQVWTGLI